MTSQPGEITFTRPDCGHVYEALYRPSINLLLDSFDDRYLEEATTTKCQECGVKYDVGTLATRRRGDGGTVIEV